MNAEEAGLALNVVEIGMLAAAGFFVYERFFSDPSGGQEAPFLMNIIVEYKHDYPGDLQKLVDDHEGDFVAAQQFIDDNKINNSTTLNILQKIGMYAASIPSAFLKQMLSTFDGEVDPTANSWKSNDPVAQQMYQAVAAELTLILAAVADWKAKQKANVLPQAQAAILLLITQRWSSGTAPPLYSDGDIASLTNTYHLDNDDAATLDAYAAQISASLTGRRPPTKYNKDVDNYIVSLYTLAQQYTNGWTPARASDWQTWEGLEAYRFMTDLHKLGADRDTVEGVMQNIKQLTNSNYGADDYATGVQNALDKYRAACSAMLTDSVAHSTATCDYYFDVIIALFESWGVSKKVLPVQKEEGYATAIMTERNSLYGTRWGMPPAKYESSMIGLGH